jgi:hypothetical protein
MSSSISSKHAFSQGGITVSKQQNRLKGDIVKALQIVKFSIWHDLLFQEPGLTSLLELEELDDSKLEAGSGMKTAGDDSDDEDSWDIMLNDVNDDTDNDADDEVSDFEMD